MFSTFSGITIFERLSQFSNALFPIFLNCELFPKITSCNFVHPQKASSEISVIVSGIVIDSKPLQFLNSFQSISSLLLFIVIFFKLEQYSNGPVVVPSTPHQSDSIFTFPGILMDCKEEQ